jgi:secondary thiamine-phosphate synthase enzyme
MGRPSISGPQILQACPRDLPVDCERGRVRCYGGFPQNCMAGTSEICYGGRVRRRSKGQNGRGHQTVGEKAMRQFSVRHRRASDDRHHGPGPVHSPGERDRSGICCVFVPHTTAAVTINENADPDVPRDILAQMDSSIPLRGDYLHREGNSRPTSRRRSSGPRRRCSSSKAPSSWGPQSIFFCEFDGPRTRQVYVKFLPGC